jgi:hypothetical protein
MTIPIPQNGERPREHNFSQPFYFNSAPGLQRAKYYARAASGATAIRKSP